MINNLTTKTEVVAFTLTSAELEKFGLNEQDEQEIKAVAECINADDPGTVYRFGRAMGETLLIMRIACLSKFAIKI